MVVMPYDYEWYYEQLFAEHSRAQLTFIATIRYITEYCVSDYRNSSLYALRVRLFAM